MQHYHLDNIRGNDRDASQQADKSTDMSHTQMITLCNFVEKRQTDDIINILEREKIQKATLNKGITIALNNSRGNGDMADIIDILLSHGADPNFHVKHPFKNEKDSLITILMYACIIGDPKIIKTILDYHPDANLKDKTNKNALLYSILFDKDDNGDIVLALIRGGININESGRVEQIGVNGVVSFATHSPLTLAVTRKLKSIVKILIEHGADVNFNMLPEEDTALHIASRNGYCEIIHILLKSSHINLKALNKEDKTAFALALAFSHNEIYLMIVERIKQLEYKEKSCGNLNLNVNSNLNSNSPEGIGVDHTHQDEENSNSNFNQSNNEDLEDNDNNNPQEFSTQKFNSNSQVPVQVLSLNSQSKNAYQAIKCAKIALNRKKIQNLNRKYSKYSHCVHHDNPCSYLEIPIEFKEKIGKSTSLHSFIKMLNPPKLCLDLSDDSKENSAILSYKVEELNFQLSEQNKLMKSYEEKFTHLNDENTKLKMEITGFKDLLEQKDKALHNLQIEIRMKEEQLIGKINELQFQLEDKIMFSRDLIEKTEKLEKELMEMTSSSRNFTDSSISKSTRKEVLERKFLPVRYDDKYIIKCLQRDILDFQEFNKDQIKRNKNVLDELLKLVQSSINECIPEYEVRLYGSHATNLCLPWSDLDIVIIHKRTYSSNNYSVLQTLYLHLLEKGWKKSIKFIDTAVIPIIKITAVDEYNSMQMDISLQDQKHYGLKCVELVKSFMGEYEALEPLIFALKNLLKNANLNDPYTGGLSSYGLILMIVSYLQSQKESNKSISLSEGNIGRLFLEFLCYYGLIFDHTKYVIYTYPPSDLNYTDKENNPFFFNMQSGHELIIVDPLNKSNNVARSSYQFVNIKMAFMIGFVVSREECECGCHFTKSGNDTDSTAITNSEHCILKRIFNSVKRFNAGVNSS